MDPPVFRDVGAVGRSAGSMIHPDTAIGSVHLTVRDLDRSIAFYDERLGFRVRSRDHTVAHLGAGGADLLVLWGRRDAPRARRTTGLYHFAVRVPSRRDLAETLGHLLATHTALTGSSDHGVSEAIYLPDPEGNGIEIYRDRPRGEWPLENGQVRMATDPLDVDGLLAERREGAEPWSGLAPGTTIGHVHLHVANLDDDARFYVGVLGFEPTARLGDSALFVSAGGYHHHIGLNTWVGVGAPPPPVGRPGCVTSRWLCRTRPSGTGWSRVRGKRASRWSGRMPVSGSTTPPRTASCWWPLAGGGSPQRGHARFSNGA